MKNKELEKEFYRKLHLHNVENDGSKFKSFKELPSDKMIAKEKRVKIIHSLDEVIVNSKLEEQILKLIDNFSYVKQIKTQSLEIEFPSHFGKSIKHYQPDFQILTWSGTIIIIEVKPIEEMVNFTNMRKNKSLEKYCKDNGYTFQEFDYIDNHFYSFDELKKEKVSNEIKDAFVEFIKLNGPCSYYGCKSFKEQYNIGNKEIANIIYSRKKELIYLKHEIKYKKKI